VEEYRVNLDIYNGPLDLLLYLIRREEVDIHDIPIARITEQYIQYVEMIKTLDPDLAGEFMVLAATLMEIKTRMLLPAPEAGEDAEGLEIDPRAELVRQLLQYKAFKDAAADLGDAAAQQALRFARPGVRLDGDGEPSVDLEDVQIWDLFDAFSKIMEAIGHRATHHEVIYDDTPIELHAADILDRLARDGPMTFDRIFEGRTVRTEIVGLFLAMLELVRRKRIICRQDNNFGQILVELNPNPPAQGLQAEPAADTQGETQAPEQPAPPAEAAKDAATALAGTYVPDAPASPGGDDGDDNADDDAGTETSPAGD